MTKLNTNIIHRLIYIFTSRSWVSSTFLIQLSDSLRKAAEYRIIKENKGKHPKHEIIKYYEFFQKHVSGDDVVIDIGCSKGELTNKVAKVAKKVYGVEIVSQNYQLAIKGRVLDNIEFIHGDIYKYQMSQDVNTAIMSNVLEHLERRIELLTLLRQKCKKLLIRIPAIDREWWPYYLKSIGAEYRLDYTHYIEHSREEILEELKQSGWTVDSIYSQWGEFYIVCN